MEDAAAAPASPDAQSRRKSGRVVRQPRLYADDPNFQSSAVNGAIKRKRGTKRSSAEIEDGGEGEEEGEDGDDVNGQLDEQDSSDPSEGEPDEEELKARRKRARSKKQSGGGKQPAAKKPRTKGDGTMQLAMRPAGSTAANGVKKASKPRKARPKARPSATNEQGLYSEVFAQGKTGDEVAIQWLKHFGEDPVSAMRDLVNFILRCTGFDGTVDNDDIEDVDHVTGKLEDLQDAYIAQQIHDYPLISRTKGSVFSRNVMTDFIESLLETAHQSEVLYNDVAFIENMQAWVAAMTSSAIRPFRHTATVVGLAMGTALCGLDKQFIDIIATTTRQKEGEQKRKNSNKERVKGFEAKLKEQEERKGNVEAWIKDVFDSIFVMRYRDVDLRVRVDCASALGSWIHTCPETFFTGEYIRYLGWLLSDVGPAARGEVLKQLTRLYEDPENTGRLRAFTERFKGRMVEMACQDADSVVRAAAIELLDTIRDMGYLEPEDVDAVGKLVFDTDPRVRKSVTTFFAANVEDVLEATTEEIGGDEILNEALGEGDDEDFEQPRRAWLKFKALAEILEAYDDEDAEVAEAASLGANHLIDTGGGTRFSVAGEVICAGVADVKNWESLAGYLLYDFSKGKKGRANDPMTTFKKRCAPTERQESILLEILQVAVRVQLEEAMGGSIDRKRTSAKARGEESRAVQEATAQSLSHFLPKLLGRFGGSPSTIIAVLRLEQLLNMDLFQELRQDSSEFASLLDDIGKQFTTHADSSVLEAARNSLLHARGADEYIDVTDSKVEEIWADTLKPLHQAASTSKTNAKTLASAVQRINNLASIVDCVDLLEAEIPGNKRKSIGVKNVHDYLCALITAFKEDVSEDAERVMLNSMQALLFYTMWKIKHVKEALSEGEEVDWEPNAFPSVLMELIDVRQKLDDLRLAAIGCLLDTHLAFTSLRQIETDDSDITATISNLIREVSPDAKKAIQASFVAAEKDFAKKAGRNLDKAGAAGGGTSAAAAAEDEGVDVNGEPDAPESDSEDEEEEEEEEEEDEDRRRALQITSERQLCELTGKIVLAIVGRVLDSSDPGKGRLRRRIQQNKSKLGGYFKEVLGYLDEPKKKGGQARGGARPKTPGGAGGAAVNGSAGGAGAASTTTPTSNVNQKKGAAAAAAGAATAKSAEIVNESDDEDDDDGAAATAAAGTAATDYVAGDDGDDDDREEEEEIIEGDENDLRKKGVLIDKDEGAIDGPPVDDESSDEDDDVMGE